MNRPIKSPLKMANSPLFLVKLAADLLKVHKDFLSKVDEFLREITSFKEEAARIKNLPKGDKGDQGPRGAQGPAGARGPAGQDGVDAALPNIASLVEEVYQRVLHKLPKPKDGKDARKEEVVAAVIKELDLDEKLKKMTNEMASYRSQLAGKHYGEDTWARGGGDTLADGINTTLTHNPDGTVSVNATGSSGNQVDNEVVSGSGTAWTLAHTPTTNTLRLYANGQRLTPMVDYSLLGADITTVLSWDAGTLLADYSYP